MYLDYRENEVIMRRTTDDILITITEANLVKLHTKVRLSKNVVTNLED